MMLCVIVFVGLYECFVFGYVYVCGVVSDVSDGVMMMMFVKCFIVDVYFVSVKVVVCVGGFVVSGGSDDLI